ncbi:unnamed protein product [Callosobruchus maculatus]|uniref:Uncharacterized protein n=1 Tax=Callosobruchus maculatus TaxID=64391 RepID=A0A653CSX7_CALMS|nr:unnamed protein product [Callosobruchus maculatus]
MPSTKTTELSEFVTSSAVAAVRSVDRCRSWRTVRYYCSLLSNARVFRYQCYRTVNYCNCQVSSHPSLSRLIY